jgi:hypothetical protein
MANVTRIAVSLNIARPLESCSVCMTRSNVSCLEGFELLLRAKLVRLEWLLAMAKILNVAMRLKRGRTYHLEIGGCKRRLMLKARKVVLTAGK